MYLAQNQVYGIMEVLKIQFHSQKEANKHFEEMEKLADQVCDEQSAIKMIEMVEICYDNQEEYLHQSDEVSLHTNTVLYMALLLTTI